MVKKTGCSGRGLGGSPLPPLCDVVGVVQTQADDVLPRTREWRCQLNIAEPVEDTLPIEALLLIFVQQPPGLLLRLAGLL